MGVLNLDKKISTGFISTIVFALLVSCLKFIPFVNERYFYLEEYKIYFGFFEIFTFFLIVSGIFYFLILIPLSYLIDQIHRIEIFRSGRNSYFAKLLIYTLIGSGLGLPYRFSDSPNLVDVMIFMFYGIFATNFFYHILFIFQKDYHVISKENNFEN